MISGMGVAYAATGFVFLWSGVKNATLKATLTSFLKGQQPAPSPTGAVTVGVSDGASSSASTPASAAAGDTGAASGTAAANQAIGKMLATAYGWGTGTEWDDLVSLWNRESGWSNTAQNASSGAYGIPQSLPYSKMPKAAWPPSAGGSASASAQIAWGLSYIKATYGSPSQAWAHEQSAGWY